MCLEQMPGTMILDDEGAKRTRAAVTFDNATYLSQWMAQVIRINLESLDFLQLLLLGHLEHH
jgi:hypothetical protein